MNTPHHHDHHNHMAPPPSGRPTAHHADHRPVDGSKSQKHDHHAHMVGEYRKRFWIAAVATIPIILLSPMLQHWLGLEESFRFDGDMVVLFVLSSFVYVYGGFPFLKGLFAELRARMPGMMTLVSLAITTAYVYSTLVVLGLSGETFFWETATLIDIMLLGHWIEMRSVMGASRALEELAALMPADAHRIIEGGRVEEVPLEKLNTGDRVLVKPGEKIPADGAVIEGESSVNEAMLTGEAKPVSKKQGETVIGGSINGEGSLTIEVMKTGKESFLSQVIDLVKEAQESKSKTQDLANRAALWLTLIAMAGGAVTFFVWLLIMQSDLAFALERTVTVMVIACPHALGLAVPLVVAVSTALSARNGLLIRNRVAFERARNINAVVFDKTGTLTEGRFAVTDVVVLQGHRTKDELLSLAAAVESRSEHPIAKAIAASTDTVRTIEGFKAIPGKGAEAKVEGKMVRVVSPGFLREQNLLPDHPAVEKLSGQGKTVVFVQVDHSVAGFIALGDVVRPESKGAIHELKALGIRTIMLTGDNKAVAKSVAEELQLDEFIAEVLPEHKAAVIKDIQSRGMIVAMTGDGVNDAPALAQADVGIAIGAGTDVAVESADVVLINSNPRDVVAIISLARATYRKMVQNLVWATGYNAFAMPLAAGVLFSAGILLSPALGAVLMSLSTVIVAINARFLKLKTR